MFLISKLYRPPIQTKSILTAGNLQHYNGNINTALGLAAEGEVLFSFF